MLEPGLDQQNWSRTFRHSRHIFAGASPTLLQVLGGGVQDGAANHWTVHALPTQAYAQVLWYVLWGMLAYADAFNLGALLHDVCVCQATGGHYARS